MEDLVIVVKDVLVLLQYKMDAILDLILKAYVPWSSAMEDLVIVVKDVLVLL